MQLKRVALNGEFKDLNESNLFRIFALSSSVEGETMKQLLENIIPTITLSQNHNKQWFSKKIISVLILLERETVNTF